MPDGSLAEISSTPAFCKRFAAVSMPIRSRYRRLWECTMMASNGRSALQARSSMRVSSVREARTAFLDAEGADLEPGRDTHYLQRRSNALNGGCQGDADLPVARNGEHDRCRPDDSRQVASVITG